MTEIGDCFRIGEVWISPRGTEYTVDRYVQGSNRLRVVLKTADRTINRDWDAVIGWVRPPERNVA